MERIRITDMDVPVPTEAMKGMLASLEGQHISMDRDDLLNLAKEQLDVAIDIDDGLIDRFMAVFNEAVANAPMHQVGRMLFQQLVVGGIVQNSRMNAIRKAHPEIANTPIKEPLVVAGMPRSGTTYLLQLLASENDFTSIKKWESTTPFPSQKVLRGEAPDTRIEMGEEAIKLIHSLAPYEKYIYDVGAEEHTEEIEVMVQSAYTCAMSFFGDVPNFDNALYASDQIQDYQHMYDTLQTMAWVKKANPKERWLLKSPQHMGGLVGLDTVFPDARIVFTHRDPASVFTSLLTLGGYAIRRLFSSMSKQQLIDRAKRMQHGFLRGIIAHADRFEGRCEHIYFTLVPEHTADFYLRHDPSGPATKLTGEEYGEICVIAMQGMQTADFQFFFVTEGDFVAALGRLIFTDDRQWDWVQLFRLEDGRLAETWLPGMGVTVPMAYPRPDTAWKPDAILPQDQSAYGSNKVLIKSWFEDLAAGKDVTQHLAPSVRWHDIHDADISLTPQALQARNEDWENTVTDYIKGKSIIVTGAASGFGKLVSEKAAAMGAKVTCADINAEGLDQVVADLTAKGLAAQGQVTDVRDPGQVAALAQAAIDKYDAIDVMVNNAGTMPLAFFADHAAALEKWHQCIDINLKGVINGIAAVHDQMIKQGRGHVINVSSIYGNAPVAGSGVYSATKTAVNYISDTLRVESAGKIKVTAIRPTGVATNLSGTMVNPAASIGIMGHYGPEELQKMAENGEGYFASLNPDEDSMEHRLLDPQQIADNIIYAINQPWGVSISDITIRCSGDIMIL
eukprot:g3392.t1